MSVLQHRLRYRPAWRRGFVLVSMAVITVGVLAVVGLAVDIGRMFIAKNELQLYCDSAAVAAAMALNGSNTGIANAATAVAGSTNKWNFGTTSVSGASVAYATASTGPWVASPSPATGYMYAQVSASVPVPLYFLPLVTGQGTFTVTAVGAAGLGSGLDFAMHCERRGCPGQARARLMRRRMPRVRPASQ